MNHGKNTLDPKKKHILKANGTFKESTLRLTLCVWKTWNVQGRQPQINSSRRVHILGKESYYLMDRIDKPVVLQVRKQVLTQ